MSARFFDDTTVFRHPAEVLTRARGVEMDRDALMRIARERAFDPDIFEEAKPFF